MRAVTCQELLTYLENNLFDFYIVNQEMEYKNGEKKYQEIRGLYQTHNIELKHMQAEFLKIEIEKEGKEKLEELIGALDEIIDNPIIRYDLAKVENDENIAVVEWHNKAPEERLQEIFTEDVYAAGYECYNIEKVKVLKLKNYGIHPRTALDMGLGGEYY